eukprot:SAG11_NODE_124_length_15798_cov_14.675776_17_plen_67_part_00
MGRVVSANPHDFGNWSNNYTCVRLSAGLAACLRPVLVFLASLLITTCLLTHVLTSTSCLFDTGYST